MSVGRYWILTIPHHGFVPYLPPTVVFIKGQLEKAPTTGYLHWQVLSVFSKNVRLSGVKRLFGDWTHAELTRSAAADAYVHKEDTSVEGTRFELGERPLKRNSNTDWEAVRTAAQSGNFDTIPPDIYVRCYSQLKNIAKDHLQPVALERTVNVYWGRTGTGKSRRAWEEAGLAAYPKDPRSKFWDGYRSQTHVVIDEFRGGVDIGHVLRWFDRYPVIVEAKHGATVLAATTIWITSNLDPRLWYPEIDQETKDALLRRLTITHFNGNPLVINPPA